MDPREEGRLTEAVERLTKEVTELNSRVEKRFDGVEARIDRVETRIDGVDQRIIDVEKNFNNKFWSAVKWVGVVTGTIIVAGGFAIWALIGVIWMFIDK